MTRAQPRVVGIGEPSAGDDVVGLAVVDAARPVLGRRADVIGLRDPARLVELLARPAPTLLVDAVASDAEPGTLVWLTRADLATSRAWSSHGLDVPAALDLAAALHGDEAVAEVEVLGIAIRPSTDPGHDVDRRVAGVVAHAVRAILAWVTEVTGA